MDQQFINTFELTRLGLEVAGQTPLARFSRLLADLPEEDDLGDVNSGEVNPGEVNPDVNSSAVVQWSVRGKQTLGRERFLTVTAQADIVFECQRCLSLFTKAISVDNVLQVVGSEGALDDDPDLDPEATERIAGSQRLDVLALIEDELILSMPYVPMHDVCPSLPDSLVASGVADDADGLDADAARSSPFAVLSKLKKD